MERIDHCLPWSHLGSERQISVFRFGSGERKAYIQASLHADELPGMRTAWELKKRLADLEAQGQLKGVIELVPVANPIGLDQHLQGSHMGRFELGSSENFNRHYPAFAADIFHELKAELGQDAKANTRLIRERLRSKVAAIEPASELAAQRKTLMLLACDADVVLDLHCDFEATMHMYVEQPMVDQMVPLARLLGAEALLWARGSGPSISFDEALSGPWWRLQEHFRDRAPVPLACASTPASSADARAMGILFITRSNQPVAPTMTMRTALMRNAPTASAMVKPPAMPAVASTAAPGVLQAIITGWRSTSEGTAEHSPMPSPSAHIQEVICAGVAPKACAAWNTMATELVKPTSTATKPAVAAERLRSLKNGIGRFSPRCIAPQAFSGCRPRSARRGRRLPCAARRRPRSAWTR